MATRLNKKYPNIARVIDLSAGASPNLVTGDVVCISISSSLVYHQAIVLASRFKHQGKTIVLGGPYVTEMYRQIGTFRGDIFDFMIRGKGEKVFLDLYEQLIGSQNYSGIPNLSFHQNGNVVHMKEEDAPYVWEESVPLDLSILIPSISEYWKNFQERIDATSPYMFQVFTHFGCRYRDNRLKLGKNIPTDEFAYCSFCGLKDVVSIRSPEAVTNEIKHYLEKWSVPKGSKVTLKCYGDNAAPEIEMLERLVTYEPLRKLYDEYDLGWIFYVQSLFANERSFAALKKLNTRIIYIGFDSANDNVQKLNMKGTTKGIHQKAIDLARKYGILIQAGFVLGLAGETEESLKENVDFVKANLDIMERVIASIVFIIPGSPAYRKLIEKFPFLEESDYIPYQVLQRYWLDTFTRLGSGAEKMLAEYAQKLAEMSPDKDRNIIGTMGWSAGVSIK
ncbi:MAG: radical SAM protein [Candidatus Diapherotrites archaeon]